MKIAHMTNKIAVAIIEGAVPHTPEEEKAAWDYIITHGKVPLLKAWAEKWAVAMAKNGITKSIKNRTKEAV